METCTSGSVGDQWKRAEMHLASGLPNFNQNQDAEGHRFCPHTVITGHLSSAGDLLARELPAITPVVSLSPLLTSAQIQWPGLRGRWSIEERDALIGTKPYHFVLLRLDLGNGGIATGVVAFANAHHHTVNEMIPGVAGWAGYAIAAEVARLGGFPTAGQPPEHFRIDRRPTTRQRQRPTPDTAARPMPAMPSIGLTDILRVGDIVQPGTDPRIVAENTLRLFMGETLYNQLERQRSLDVSSVHFADEQRVYRLRRDVLKLRERRVRVFKNNVYSEDDCIVKNQDVPEADFYLTSFLMFLSDENIALSVVGRYNIFPPFSDGQERETLPAIWRPRVTAAMA